MSFKYISEFEKGRIFWTSSHPNLQSFSYLSRNDFSDLKKRVHFKLKAASDWTFCLRVQHCGHVSSSVEAKRIHRWWSEVRLCTEFELISDLTVENVPSSVYYVIITNIFSWEKIQNPLTHNKNKWIAIIWYPLVYK